MSREKADLCFLDRHASISQAKGTVNLPWKWAPLSKLLQPRQSVSVLCLHFIVMLQHYGRKYFHLVVWSCQTPSDCCQHELQVLASVYQQVDKLSPCGSTRHAICMLIGSPRKRRGLLGWTGRCKFMNGRHCPRFSTAAISSKLWRIGYVTSSRKRKKLLFRPNAVVSLKHHKNSLL